LRQNWDCRQEIQNYDSWAAATEAKAGQRATRRSYRGQNDNGNLPNAGLANRLVDRAGGITNVAAMRRNAISDLRRNGCGERMMRPLIPELVSELKRLAVFSGDLDIRTSLKSLLGDFAN
jgi:hypothetical protein